MSNPFDILPLNLFNLFTTQGCLSLQRHYMAILLRIYALAEFNRFGLTREVVVDEIVHYLKEANAEAEIAAEMDSARADPVVSPESDVLSASKDVSITGQKSEHDYASYLIRRLAETGWIEREHHADYSESIILPDYAFTLLEAFRTIQEQKPREFTGQLYAAHQLITSATTSKDFSPALAVTQTYENIRQVVRGLSELNQNIRRYVERAAKSTDPSTGLRTSIADLLRLQFDDYSQTLGPAYHALKTSDHVSRYRRDIINQIQAWQLDESWLTQTAESLAAQSKLSPAQAEAEISHYLQFIVHQLEGLDPLLSDIDSRHAQYLRTSLRQVRYRLGGTDGSFKDKLACLAKGLASLRDEGLTELPDEAPGLMAAPVDIPDNHSLYTPPQRRAPFLPDNIIVPVLSHDDLLTLRAATMQDVTQAFSPEKVNRKVIGFFNGHKRMPLAEIPAEVRHDMHWLTTIIAYAHHPEVAYGLEPVAGEPVLVGEYKIAPFELIRL